LKIKRGNETFTIDDEDWEDIKEEAWKQIHGNLDLKNRFEEGEAIEYHVPTIDEEGKEETLILKISKLKTQRVPKRWREKREVTLDENRMIQIEESETEVVAWEEF